MPRIELRGFANLYKIFRERNWSYPHRMEVNEGCTLRDLLHLIDINIDEVEAILVNGKVQTLDYKIRDRDRIALIPPGTPGPYRMLLGFLKTRDPQRNSQNLGEHATKL
ncbi:MAG: ThiamineS protein [Thermacetogenium phaeum]|uniref:ThiamineS protein n=1 Tax=Thermacetogenium phaeum TaxID=85874 RepID=A0A117LBQ2_9THEO|nr:MAG: ThiamineS protein [Thermacetogenium phaeum]